MSIISYANFIANAEPADVQALSLLASGEVIRTTDSTQADAYQAQCQRLFQPNVELLLEFKRGLQRTGDGTIWHTFEGRVDPVAIGYVAQAAMERVAE